MCDITTMAAGKKVLQIISILIPKQVVVVCPSNHQEVSVSKVDFI